MYNAKEHHHKYYLAHKEELVYGNPPNHCIDCGKKICACAKYCTPCRGKHDMINPEMAKYKIGEKVKKCECGCGGWITFKRHHKSMGFPAYLSGHCKIGWNKGLTKYDHPGIMKVSVAKIGNQYTKGKYKVECPDKFCQTCGKKLSRTYALKGSNYCSRSCASKGHQKTVVKKRILKKCKNCGKHYLVIEYLKNSKFCSSKCFSTFSENIEKVKERRAKQIFPAKDTSIEVKIQNFLKQLGINFFTHQYISEITHAYQCDILINPQPNFMSERKVIIECDGNYWHGNPLMFPIPNEMQAKQIEEDQVRTKELVESGFGILRLWECEINKMILEEFKGRLFRFSN